MMAKSSVEIKFQTVGQYRWTELYMTKRDGKDIFVVWMDKFYSAESAAKLIELIDEWWKLRSN